MGQNVNIANNVLIGDNVKIQNNVSVYEGVEIENYVFCGPSIVFTNVLKPRSRFPQRGKRYYKKTIIKKSATIGANATILCGIKIGKYAFIGAGSVVTKDVPDFSFICRKSRKMIGWVDKKGNQINFDDKNGYSECGKYFFKNDIVEEI